MAQTWPHSFQAERASEKMKERLNIVSAHSASEGAASALLCCVIKGESGRADLNTKQVFINLIPPQDAMNMQPIKKKRP